MQDRVIPFSKAPVEYREAKIDEILNPSCIAGPCCYATPKPAPVTRRRAQIYTEEELAKMKAQWYDSLSAEEKDRWDEVLLFWTYNATYESTFPRIINLVAHFKDIFVYQYNFRRRYNDQIIHEHAWYDLH